VADADDGTPVAELALIRAGERPAEGAIDDLERVGLADLRAPAIAAVGELSGVVEDRERAIPEGNPALAALGRIRDEHPDPWVRAAADHALE